MKQVIVAREDLKLSKGKLAVQVAHASVDAVLKSSSQNIQRWMGQGAKKVVLRVATEKDVLVLQQEAKREKLVAAVIHDAGKTHLEPGTLTCLAIGPDEENKIDKVTGHLKMVN